MVDVLMAVNLPQTILTQTNKGMKILIDGDILVYRIGFASQRKGEDGVVIADPVSFALHSMKKYLFNMYKETGATSSELILTGKDNFRNVVDKEYKANRKGTAKPVHYQAIRDYMVSRLKAIIVDTIEADDYMAMNQTKDTMICTLDKDLLMVKGWHYNFVKKEKRYVTQEEGTRWFYKQMLMGDKVDNIIGIKGIGDKTADKLLDSVQSNRWDALVEEKYEEHFQVGWYQRMVQNTQLLWMIQKDVLMPMDIRGGCT